MYKYNDIAEMSCKIIEKLNKSDIKCTVLTKGEFPKKLSRLNKDNEFGITLITIEEKYRKLFEPGAAPIKARIKSLYNLHKAGMKTWVSIEPYPTPNIVKQNFEKILEAVSFVDKIIFGKLNYNPKASQYTEHKKFYNEISCQVIEFCKKYKKGFYIKKGTMLNGVKHTNRKKLFT
jgi:DNA repair photolyase